TWSHCGFSSGSTNTFVANTLVSTQVINLQRESTLYLHSDIANNGQNNVLQEVFSTSNQDFSSIVFQQQSVEGYLKDISTNSNNVYRFYLTDEDSNMINLNGQNINITLLLYLKK